MISHFDNARMEYEDHARALADKSSNIIVRHRAGKTFYISKDVSERLGRLLIPPPIVCLCGLDVRDCGGCMDGELMPNKAHAKEE